VVSSGSFTAFRMTAGTWKCKGRSKDEGKTTDRRRSRNKVTAWVERSERLWPGGFFGILHCVQDDGRDLEVQRQLQLQLQRLMQRLMRRQKRRQVQMRGFFASLRMTMVWDCGGRGKRQRRGQRQSNDNNHVKRNGNNKVKGTVRTTSKLRREQHQCYGENNVKATARATSRQR
jgi:hypothetical protein